MDNSPTRAEQQTDSYPDTSADIADNLLDEYDAIRSIRYPAVPPVDHSSPSPVLAPGDVPASAPSWRHPPDEQIVIDAVGLKQLENSMRRGVPFRNAASKAALASRAARAVPWNGRSKLARELAGLPRAVPPAIEAAPVGVMSLVPDDNANDASDTRTGNSNNKRGSRGGADDGAAADDPSGAGPRDNTLPSHHGGSSNPPLTSPAPTPCANGSNTERMDAHDPTPTGQLYSHFPPPEQRSEAA